MAHAYKLGDRSDVYAVMPKGVRSILDVGCSRGGFCALVKRLHPEIDVWGIEPDGEAAAEAAARADRVVVGMFPADIPTGAPLFDVIAFGDVLEHMINPGAALRAAIPLLSDRGVVLASIPNFRHWRAFKSIFIKGDFTYTDTGLFDRTHVRFFTRSTMLHLFESNGFSVEACVPSNRSHSLKARLVRGIMPGIGAEITTLHYIIRGRPKRDA